LISFKNISVNSSLDKINKQINLAVKTDSEFRRPIICATWGLHVIWLKSIDNLEIVSTDTYDRCFSIKTINETAQIYSFSYDNYGVLDSSDFIHFYLIDEKQNIVERIIDLNSKSLKT